MSNRFYHNGDFKTIREIAKEEKVSTKLLREYIEKWGYNESLGMLIPKLIYHDGYVRTIEHWARIYKIRKWILKERIKIGYSFKAAINIKYRSVKTGRNIKRYKNTKYLVFRDGRIFDEINRFFLKTYVYKNMLFVVLNEGNYRYRISVKKLVAKIYVNNPDNLSKIEHKDKLFSNCHADNLYWTDGRSLNRNDIICEGPIRLVNRKRESVVIRIFNDIEELTHYFNIEKKILLGYIINNKVIYNKYKIKANLLKNSLH